MRPGPSSAKNRRSAHGGPTGSTPSGPWGGGFGGISRVIGRQLSRESRPRGREPDGHEAWRGAVLASWANFQRQKVSVPSCRPRRRQNAAPLSPLPSCAATCARQYARREPGGSDPRRDVTVVMSHLHECTTATIVRRYRLTW